MTSHLIQRQVLELTCRSPQTARRAESELRSVLEDVIRPRLDRICSKLAGEDEVVRIDRLELDLGEFSPDRIRTDFAATFCRIFEREIRARLDEGPGRMSSETTGAAAAFVAPESEKPGEGSSKAEGMMKLSPFEAHIEAFERWLRTGTLPWWWNGELSEAGGKTETAPAAPGILRQLLAGKDPAAAGRAAGMLRTVLRDSSAARRRLALQAPSELVRTVLERLVTEGPVPVSVSRWILEFHEAVWRGSGESRHQAKPARLVDVEQGLLRLAVAPEGLGDDPEAWRRELIGGLAPPVRRHFEADLRSPEREGSLAEMADEPQEFEPDPGDRDSSRKEDPGTEWYVQHAGLVLLWPFLEQFFGLFDLLNDDNSAFVDEAARFQAIHLLYLLATGDGDGAPEERLTFQKVLTGLPVDEPVPYSVDLGDRERDEAESLLDAVRSHWDALKNTSNRGFRESFLQREGKLSFEPDGSPLPGWKLQVEQKSFDVIMDRIPWGIYVVKLPWMPEPVHVEW